MEKSLLWIGLALLALWVILQVTEVVLGAFGWVILIAALALVAYGAVRHFGRTRHA